MLGLGRTRLSSYTCPNEIAADTACQIKQKNSVAGIEFLKGEYTAGVFLQLALLLL
jgi:hypothetical protein